jgi:RNA polymerase sigma factor (sigma-70 family)
MINANLRLAAKAAFSFRRAIKARGGELCDAMQEAVIGLNRAVVKFDPTRGYRFSTYATLWCNQAIRRHIACSLDVIRRSLGAQDVVRRWRYRPEGADGKPQSLEAFCEQWNYKPEKVMTELRLHAQSTCRSLDEQTSFDDREGMTIAELIADEQNAPSLDELDFEMAVQAIESALPDDAALVGLIAVDGAKGKDIAELLDMRVSTANQQLANARARLATVGAEFRGLVAA